MQSLIFRNGKGVEVELTKAPYGITQWEGFSATEANIQSQQVPFNDGSVFLDALLSNRELTVKLSINDENDLAKRYELRREIIALMNPKLGEGVLLYSNDFTTKQIKVIPNVPVIQNKNANQSGTVKASLTWTACNPYWEDVDEKTIVFDITEQPVIENEGDVPAPIKIDMYSTKVVNPIISNLTTEKKVGLNGTFTFAEIDTTSGRKSIEGYHIYGEYLTSNLNFIKIIYIDELKKFLAIGNQYGTHNSYILESVNSNDWKIINFFNGDYVDISYNPNNSTVFVIGNVLSNSQSHPNAYDKGIIRKSSNGGYNWNDIEVELADVSFFDNLQSILGQEKGYSNKMIIFGKREYWLSEDRGESWTKYSQNSLMAKGAYLYNHNGISLYVAYWTKIYTSEDAINWVERQDTVTYTSGDVKRSVFINSLAFNYDSEGNFIDTVFAVGDYGFIFRSKNLINWTYTNNTNLNELKDILYHPLLNLFVVSGRNTFGENPITPVLVCNDKEHWETISLSFPTYTYTNIHVSAFNICFSKTLGFVLIQCSDTLLNYGSFAKSFNCYDWETYHNDIGASHNTVIDFAEGNNTIIAGTEEGLLKVGDDDNLKRWEVVNFGASRKQVTYGNGIFLAILDSERVTDEIQKSVDGVTWELVTLPYSAKWRVLRTEKRNDKFRYFWLCGNDENGNIVVLRNTMIGVSDGTQWTRITQGLENRTNIVNDMAFENNIPPLSMGGYLVTDGTSFRVQGGSSFWTRPFPVSVNIKSICYVTRRRCFIAVGETDETTHRAVIYKSPLINGKFSYWQKVYESAENDTCLYSCAYSKEENLILVVGQGFTVASVGGEDWEKVSFENNFIPFHSVFFSEKEHCFLLGGEGTLICKTKFNNKENLIEHITDDSDMSLSLDVGENVLRLNYDEGYILAKVTYREKYLGV